MFNITKELDPSADGSPLEQLNHLTGAQSDFSSSHGATSNFTHSALSRKPSLLGFKFSISVALLSVVLLLPSLWYFPDPQSSSFLHYLPAALEHHYSKGKVINIHVNKYDPPIEIFKFESENSSNASEKVVIVHGIGLGSFSFRKVVTVLGEQGFHAIAFDLPGHGFSSTLVEETWEKRGIFGKLVSVYNLIREKGVFWALETAIETGAPPFEEIELLLQKGEKVWKPVALGSDAIGKILGDLIDESGLAPVHLVLHDSSVAMVGNWVSENPNVIRSVTLLNPSPNPALPLGFLKSPPVFFLASRFNAAYSAVVRYCCSSGMSISDLAAHRSMFRNGASAMIAMSKKVDRVFDLKDWGQSMAVKTMPLHVIWSRDWSSRWSEVAEVFARAKLESHSGGRWPNENSSKEIGHLLYDFISPLPKSRRPTQQNVQRLCSSLCLQ